MKAILLKNSNLVDVRTKSIVKNVDILIEKGIITKIDNNLARADAEVVDCTDKYVVPGVIDTHVHLTWNGTPDPVDQDNIEGSHVAIIRALNNAQASLQKGVTTIREVGSLESVAVPLAYAINKGIVPGPTIVPCGAAIQSVYGHVPDIGILADSNGEIIKAIRGMKMLLTEKLIPCQWIKIMATGGAAGLEEVGPSMYSLEQLELIVHEAHRLHMRVAAHALSKEGIINCIKAGIDTIEHGAEIPEEYLEMMKEKNLTLVPTLAIYKILADSQDIVPDKMVEKSKAVVEKQKTTFAKALEMGVRIALGTDSGSPNFGPQPAAFKEMLVMNDYGMAKEDVVRSATIVAAEVLGMDDIIGSIEEGKDADVLILSRNPFEDLHAFTDLERVYKKGVLFN